MRGAIVVLVVVLVLVIEGAATVSRTTTNTSTGTIRIKSESNIPQLFYEPFNSGSYEKSFLIFLLLIKLAAFGGQRLG
jgi:hypothetical protein